MCGVKLSEKVGERLEDLMGLMPGLVESIEQMARVNEMQWYGWEEDCVLRRVLKFKVNEPWRELVKEEIGRVSLRKEDAQNWAGW